METGFNVNVPNFGYYTKLGKVVDFITFRLLSNVLKKKEYFFIPSKDEECTFSCYYNLDGEEGWREFSKGCSIPAESNTEVSIGFDELREHSGKKVGKEIFVKEIFVDGCGVFKKE